MQAAIEQALLHGPSYEVVCEKALTGNAPPAARSVMRSVSDAWLAPPELDGMRQTRIDPDTSDAFIDRIV